MMLPEDVMEVWMDVIHSCSYSFLPPPLSSSLCLYLGGFRAYGKHLWDPGHRPLSRFPLSLSRRICFVQTTWELIETGRRQLHPFAELSRSPKEPWKGIGAFPDTFGMAHLLFISSVLCALCCTDLKLLMYYHATAFCVWKHFHWCVIFLRKCCAATNLQCYLSRCQFLLHGANSQQKSSHDTCRAGLQKSKKNDSLFTVVVNQEEKLLCG